MYVFFFEKNGKIKEKKREEKKWSKDQNKGKTKIRTKKNKKNLSLVSYLGFGNAVLEY